MFDLSKELLKDAEFLKELAVFCKSHGYTIISRNPEIKIDNSERKAEFEVLFRRDLVS